MNTSKFLRRLYITAAIATMATGSMLIPAQGNAATSTGIGATSTGTVNIQVDKPVQADISAMTDMLDASWVIGDGAVALDTTACVYSTGAVGSTAGDYTILATGQNNGTGGAGTAFFLVDATTLAGASHNIPYTVTWNTTVGAGGTALTANVTSGQFAGASTTDSACGGVNNVQVNIAITNAAMSAAAAGDFSDTLTLVISPD